MKDVHQGIKVVDFGFFEFFGHGLLFEDEFRVLYEHVHDIRVEKNAPRNALKWISFAVQTVLLLASIEHPTSASRVPLLKSVHSRFSPVLMAVQTIQLHQLPRFVITATHFVIAVSVVRSDGV